MQSDIPPQADKTNAGTRDTAQDETIAPQYNTSSENTSREGSAADSSAEPPTFFESLEQDIILVSASFEAIVKWCMNTSEIMALEARTAIHALPRFLLARFAFVILQLFSWVLIVLSASYAVYAYTGSVAFGLATAAAVQFMASLVFYLYIRNLKRDLYFAKTRAEFSSLKKSG